jgi:membrane carboxypeptidase/penicillin-binding protein
LNQPSAGKTGTISDNKAVWFDGYTPNMAAAATVAGANFDGHQQTLNGHTVGGVYITSAHGSTNAGPIWGDAMKAIQQYLPDTDFHAPDPQTIEGQMVTIPSVYGSSPEQAAQVLRKAGFNPVIGPMVDSSNSYGTVAYLSPGSGGSAGTGSSVTIYVSDGTPAPAPPPPKPGGGGGGGGKPGHGNGHGNGHGGGGGGGRH